MLAPTKPFIKCTCILSQELEGLTSPLCPRAKSLSNVFTWESRVRKVLFKEKFARRARERMIIEQMRRKAAVMERLKRRARKWIQGVIAKQEVRRATGS
jgi:hypothetical protein